MRLPLFIVLCSALHAKAATIVIGGNGLGTHLTGHPSPGVPSFSDTRTFTFDIGDRTGLVPGADILVTVNMLGFSAAMNEVFAQSSYTFTNKIDVSAVLGGQTGAATATLTINGLAGENVIGSTRLQIPSYPAIQFTVPWGTDLTALGISVTQTAAITGNGNGLIGIGMGAGGQGMNSFVETQSVPEPGAWVLAAGAVTAMASRRMRPARK